MTSGASLGQGRAETELFAQFGARRARHPGAGRKRAGRAAAAKAARDAIDAVVAAGGAAHYFSVNLTDGKAVAKVVADVRQRSGRIDVLLHAAGIDRSHALPDKDPREFDLVFDVKSDGLFHLLQAIGDMPLRAMAVSAPSPGGSATAGRQTTAPPTICYARSPRFRQPGPGREPSRSTGRRGRHRDGHRGSIPKVMEMAGIDMLLPAAFRGSGAN